MFGRLERAWSETSCYNATQRVTTPRYRPQYLLLVRFRWSQARSI
jgi:hypothetical protein